MSNTLPPEQSGLRYKILFAMRILTIPPLMALVLLTILYLQRPDMFGSAAAYWLALLFLVILPVLGYPLQPLIPPFKRQGREGQRSLAIVTAVIGYIAGIVYAACAHAPAGLWLIFLTYAFSGFAMLAMNKLLHLRASGHACGTAGPVAMLVYTFGPAALWGLLLLAMVFLSSLGTGRHSLRQLIGGSLIPIVSLLLAALIV